MNNKILSIVLVAGIATTGFAAISSANDSDFFSGQKSEIRELKEKVRSGEDLTADEQALLDEVKQNREGEARKHGGKRKGFKNLSQEERIALESMTDEEKKVFFEAKKAEKMAEKEARKAVVDTLIAGETLTAEQEVLRAEMLEKMSENSGKKQKEGFEIIQKVLSGETLSDDEQTQLTQMQADRAEREAQREVLKALKDKVDAGEELTDEEQALLDAAKANKKSKGKKGGKGGRK